MADGGRDFPAPNLPPKAFSVNLGGSRTSAMFSLTEPPPLPPRRSVFFGKCNGAGDLSSVPPAPSSTSTWTSSDFLRLMHQPGGEGDTKTSIKSIEALFLEDGSSRSTTLRHHSLTTSTVVSTQFASQPFPLAAAGQLPGRVVSLIGTEMTHSNSAPNFNNLSSSCNPSPIHAANQSSSVLSRTEIERSMFSVLRKKQDNNLIDLSGDAELAKKRETLRKAGDSLNDLLDLFDPLRENELEEISSPEETPPKGPPEGKSEVSEMPPQIPPKQGGLAQMQPPSLPASRSSTVERPTPVQATTSKGPSVELGTLKVVRHEVCQGEEIEAFWAKAKQLRSEFTFDDHHTNTGLVVSPTLENKWGKSLSIKVEITTSFAERPFCFTCDVGTSVEHPNGAIQAVKAICSTLSRIEILEILHAVEGLKHICSQMPEVNGFHDSYLKAGRHAKSNAREL
ncbi:hypothetical protein HPB50_004827 [Hyalomma asiaticum]|uniref:Uncharacterized protein n=1 Tax=Hyalomma asiaticum TaxID=266040 RepID=A0ACB7SKM0_HYAAI|nr:hypothetical protein HPB50_004827 [Hyalomma asiaticum]